MTTNFPGNSRSRLKQRTLLFRFLAEINLIFGFWYLEWRTLNSINFNALWLSIPLLLAEIYSYVGGAIFTIGLWRPLEREIKSLDCLNPPLPSENWPEVDVFITCYNEPVDMVETTAQAALNIDYPTEKLRVYILDDGNSLEMRSMAQNLCLEDLQSPQLRTAAAQLKQQREDLIERLKIIEYLTPEVYAAETYTAKLIPAQEREDADRFLQVLNRAVESIDPQNPSIREQLLAQQEQLRRQIKDIELKLTELSRCRYIARPKSPGKPHYAKAGNINYAIFSGETTGKFILTLDADHIPKPQFLRRVLPYFYNYNAWKGEYQDSQVALVQTPQDFYNLPPDDPFCHRAHLFYGPIQQGKDGLNSAFFTGTNAVLRRESLINTGLKYFSCSLAKDESKLEDFTLIGGMSSMSITEDMNTAMRLHSDGWKTVYHNELLAEGLAPEDLGSTLQQRMRWAQGTIQILVQENPWTKPGLTFWQRLQYFQTMFSYFAGFGTLILIICPIVFFFTGITPVNTYGDEFAIHFLPAYLVNRVTFIVGAWGVPAREIWRSEQYATALFPLFIQSVVSVFTKRSIKFKVTPKERQAGIYYNLIWPQLTVAGLTILGIVWSIVRFATGTIGLDRLNIYLINFFWGTYNLFLLWGIIRAACWKPKPR
jgi:cellulose synthase (UDP-forming)